MAATRKPATPAGPVRIKMRSDLEEAEFVCGIWISRDQVETLPADEAGRLIREGKAEAWPPGTRAGR